MAEPLPGPSVETKRNTSGGTRFKCSWTLPENITTSEKSNNFVNCSGGSRIFKSGWGGGGGHKIVDACCI